MAHADFQVTAAGEGKIHAYGRSPHAGRLVTLDLASPEVQALLKRGLIAAPTSATQHDATAAGPSLEVVQTYHVQAGIPTTILHNGAVLAPGAAITVDPLDEPYKTMLAKGWIA